MSQTPNPLSRAVLDALTAFEQHLGPGNDVLSYNGNIIDPAVIFFQQVVEDLKNSNSPNDTLNIILTTYGGGATEVERFVHIARHHYNEVNFYIPDYAYSAGTIWCMSGDEINMDYFSVLGPIDPQVQNKEGNFVPALGYLDKVNELLGKAANGELTDAEFLILKEFDLAELRGYEQAKELTITLLKDWLVRYKFKNWDTHQTTPNLIGTEVTIEEKEKRAEEIAELLSDNNTWKSHGRPIDINTLTNKIRLKIKDYSNTETQKLIREFYRMEKLLLSQYNLSFIILTRNSAI